MGALLFTLNNTLAGLICLFTTEILFRRREMIVKIFASGAGFALLVFFNILLLGNIGLLNAGFMFLLLIVEFFILLFIRRSLVKIQSPDLKSMPKENRSSTDRLKTYLILILLSVIGGIFLGLSLKGTKYFFDDLWYHATYPAHWLQAERLVFHPMEGLVSYYPYNSELLSLWFMLPFRSDGLVSLAGLYWLGLIVLAAMALVKNSDLRNWIWFLIVILTLASDTVRNTARTFSGTDLAGSGLVLTAAYFAFSSSRLKNHQGSRIDALYAGLIAGLAAGCKLTFVSGITVIFFYILFAQRAGGDRRIRGQSIILFILGVLLTGSYWYIRNLVLTGNPIFPAQFGPWAGPLTVSLQKPTKLYYWILQAPTNIPQWSFLLKQHLDWPPGLFLLSLIGYGGTACSLMVRCRRQDTEKSSPATLLLLTGLIMLLIYPFLPFSGSNGGPRYQLRIEIRFLVTPFLIGLILFVLFAGRNKKAFIYWIMFAVFASLCPFRFRGGGLYNTAVIILITTGIVILALIGKRWLGKLSYPPAYPWSGIILFIFFLSMTFFLPRQQARSDRRIFSYGDECRPIGRAWEFINSLPAGSTIGWYGPHAEQYYPLFGRRLQLIPIHLAPDGSPFLSLHQRWREDPHQKLLWLKPNQKPKPNLDNLIDNLSRQQVNYVLTTKWAYKKGTGPEQATALELSSQARRIYHDGYSSVWQINR